MDIELLEKNLSYRGYQSMSENEEITECSSLSYSLNPNLVLVGR